MDNQFRVASTMSAVANMWDSSEWLGWWRNLSRWKALGPGVATIAYWLLLAQLGGLRFDLVVCSLLPTLLYYLGPKFRPVFEFSLPLFLTSVIYDSMRYYADYIRGPIHVAEPYMFDKFFFGIQTAAGVLTPNEWWQNHTHPVLDFFTGIAYIIFIPVYLLTAAYYRFWLGKKPDSQIAYDSTQIMWAFFWVNMIGYSTYYWYAASPPWYVALYGLGPARLDEPANLAGCIRFDQLVGLPIFKNWYGRSADVHGAIPSLHVAYPLITVYYAFKFKSLRVFSIFFFLLVSFAAVYLNHHYILDIIWGSVYAIAVAYFIDKYWQRRKRNKLSV